MYAFTASLGCWVNRLSVGGGASQRQRQETTEWLW